MLLAVAALLVCSNAEAFDLKVAMDRLANAKSCCTDYSSIPVQTLISGRSSDVAVDDSGGAFDFGGNDGKSFMRAFALPPDQQGYMITVRSSSIPHNPVITTEQYFFCPIVTVLDRNRKPIAGSTLDDMRYQPGGFRDAIEVSLNISPAEGARYIIVHTPQAQAGKGYALRTHRPAAPPIFQLLGDKSTISELHQFIARPRRPPAISRFRSGPLLKIDLSA